MSIASDRILELEKEAQENIVLYHARISTGALTAISALGAILAFLVNTRHISYIQHPQIAGSLLYAIFILYGLTYIFELVSIKVRANYVAMFRDLQKEVSKGVSSVDINKLEQEKAEPIRKRLSKLQRTSEVLVGLGTIALVSFITILLFNILQAK